MKAGLYPELGPKRGEAMKWIVWGNVSLGEPVARVMHAHGDKAGADATRSTQKPSFGAVCRTA